MLIYLMVMLRIIALFGFASLCIGSILPKETIWSNATVPYILPAHYDSTSIQKIHEAFAQFHMYSCIRFVPWNRTLHGSVFLQIASSGSGYTDNIDKRRKEQYLLLDENRCMEEGVILRHLMHALGFYPESNRPDRDKYVNVLYHNIIEDKKTAFNIVHDEDFNASAVYDFQSITHFANNQWSKEGENTIEAKNDSAKLLGGSKLSNLDWVRARRSYGCPKKENLTGDTRTHYRIGLLVLHENKAISLAKSAIRNGSNHMELANILRHGFEAHWEGRWQVIVTNANAITPFIGNNRSIMRMTVYEREILIYKLNSRPSVTESCEHKTPKETSTISTQPNISLATQTIPTITTPATAATTNTTALITQTTTATISASKIKTSTAAMPAIVTKTTPIPKTTSTRSTRRFTTTSTTITPSSAVVSDHSPPHYNMEFDAPDLSAPFNIGEDTVYLIGFKVRQRSADNPESRPALKWVSAGYPTLQRWSESNKIFKCTKHQCSMRLQMLTTEQRQKLLEVAKETYGSRAPDTINCIDFLRLSHLSCSTEIHRDGLFDENPSKIKIYGSVYDLLRTPLTVHFELAEGSQLRKIFDYNVLNASEPVMFKCSLSAGARSTLTNSLTISSEQVQSTGLSDKIFGPANNNAYVTRTQAQHLSQEIASKLRIVEEYEIGHLQFDEMFIDNLLKASGSNFQPVAAEEVFRQISHYGLQIDGRNLSPDEIKREFSSALEINTAGNKEHIIAGRESANSEKTASSSDESGSASVKGCGWAISDEVSASVSVARSNSRDWATSSKSLDDQLREINDHSENHIQWERDGLKIIPKSINVAKINKAALIRSMPISRIRKQITDAKFIMKFEVNTQEEETTTVFQRQPTGRYSASSCNANFTLMEDSYCYYASDIYMTFDDANRDCQERGAHLVSIHSYWENLIAMKFLLYAHEVLHWRAYRYTRIGLQCHNASLSLCRWTDGSRFDYSALDVENHVSVYGWGFMFINASLRGWWSTLAGINRFPFVCKHRSSVVVPETSDNQLPNCNIGYWSADSNTLCYGFDSLNYDVWSSCDSYCVQIGGRCASIHNRQQNSDIYALFQTTQPPSDLTDITNGFHIGLKERSNTNTWYWVDGTPYGNTFWAPGYPSSGQTPYVSAATNGLWATAATAPVVFRSIACRHDPITQLSNNICPTAEYFGMGEIRSPGFPENYAFNRTCTYTLYDQITADPAQHIGRTKLALYFITFVTHPLDVVEIFDGPNVNSPLIANISGIAGAKQEYYSTGYNMTIRFISRVGNNFKGWRAVFGPYTTRP